MLVRINYLASPVGDTVPTAVDYCLGRQLNSPRHVAALLNLSGVRIRSSTLSFYPFRKPPRVIDFPHPSARIYRPLLCIEFLPNMLYWLYLTHRTITIALAGLSVRVHLSTQANARQLPVPPSRIQSHTRLPPQTTFS